ncbi:MAG: hypothetical protein JNL97_16080 [Verrucomicrobiales bacterium]|nr:hypothetical protein [Verrucomicrobiales bacterium]
MDQARRLAARPEIAECADPEARIERLYGIVLQRSPTSEERDAGLRYVRLAESTESSGAKENAGFGAWERYAQVLLMSNEAVFVD